MGYRTCYYRTLNVGRSTASQRDAYTKAREWIDAATETIRPGVTTDKVAALWPKAEIVQAMIGNGYTDCDFAALVEIAAKGAGLALKPENIAVDDGLAPTAGAKP